MLFVDASTNRVGIGTNSPDQQLTVLGGAHINSGSTANPTIIEGSSDANLFYVDASTDRVGIGTSSPGAKLDVDGPAIFNESGAAVDFRVEGDTEANLLFVDGSADRVGIGTSSPSRALTVNAIVEATDGTHNVLLNGGDGGITIRRDADEAYLDFINNSADIYDCRIQQKNNGLRFETGGSGSTSTVMTILSGGNVGIGTVAPSSKLSVSANGAVAAEFNRGTDDGWLIAFKQGGVLEGNISVSGTTVSYNAFTGSHYAYAKDKTFEQGMLVAFNDSNKHYHNNPNSEILYGINYTAKANDSRIAGVYLDLNESTMEHCLENPYQIMAVGNGDVWVTDEGGDIATGDYLISSSTVGHAMKDNGDYEVSHIFAKATEPVDWSTVEPDSNGVKRKKIIVYFEAFDKPNYEKKFKEQQAIIESQKAEIESLKAEASNATSSSEENAQKLAELEAKLNTLLEKETPVAE